jgi:pilus assembly protein Flp/PilA
MYTILEHMIRIQHSMQRRNEEGATAVEYGLLVGLIAAVIIAAVTLLGTQINTLFNSITAAL